MKLISTAAALGAAVLITAAPAFAAATSPDPSPIHLRGVEIQPAYSFASQADPGYVILSYANEASVTATEVVFDVEAGGQIVRRFDDVGHFAPGVTIDRTFESDSEQTDQNVKVAAVTFADGTTWTSNAAAPQPRRQDSGPAVRLLPRVANF